MDYRKELIKYLGKYKYEYVEIDNEKSLKKIYELFKKNKIDEPDNSIEYLYYGVYYFFNDNIEKMIENYKKSDNYHAKDNLGYYYYKINEYDLAIECFLLTYNANKENSIYWLSKTYKMKNEIDLMIKYLIEGINLNLKDCIYLFSIYHIENKNYKFLRDELKKGCDNNNFYCYEYYADVLERFFNNNVEAEEYFIKALPYFENKYIIYNRIGYINIILNNYKKAQLYLKKAVDENYITAYVNYGYLLEKYKYYDSALNYYKKSINKNITVNALNLIINLYINIYQDYSNAIYYYNLAIQHNLNVNFKKEFIENIKEKLILLKINQFDYFLENS